MSNIVEDIASLALTLSGALCDQGVNATVAQSMQVMAFFLSDTTKDDLRRDHDHMCHRSWGRCDTAQPNRHSDVSNVAEFTVELRPAYEREPATLFVCSAEDSDITGSSNLTVGVTYKRRGQFDSERCL